MMDLEGFERQNIAILSAEGECRLLTCHVVLVKFARLLDLNVGISIADGARMWSGLSGLELCLCVVWGEKSPYISVHFIVTM